MRLDSRNDEEEQTFVTKSSKTIEYSLFSKQGTVSIIVFSGTQHNEKQRVI